MRGLFAILLALSFVLAQAPTSSAQSATSGKAAISLKQTLEKGLKARTKSEFAFIQKVVNKVHSGELSRSLVDSTFLWARQKNEHHVQYFEQAIRVRAKKQGVTL